MRKEISNLSKGILFMLLWTFSLCIFAQNITVRGIVTDATNEPLIGVTVRIQGTSTGTITDANGNFTFPNVPPNATLEISYVGMVSQNIAVNGRTAINVVLREDSEILEEVIVVGYGVQKKESIVGSIVQTSSEDIKRTGNVTDLKQALTGQLPGVVTLTSTGEPGGVGGGTNATDIYIRGRNTWNGGQPLILVDGVERSMENIDVNEVESISVLKDASATAVFGVKGANGVILVTTKRGKVSKPEMSFSYNTTALMVSRLPEKLDSYDTRRLKNEMIEREVSLNPGSWADYTPYEILKRYQRPQSAEYAEIYPNVNWAEALFDDVAWSQRTALNLTGGTDFVNYFGSVAYLHEGDMFRDYDNFKGYSPNYNFDRFNFRTNLGFNLTKTAKLKVDLSGYYSIKNTNNSYRQESSGGTNNPMVWAAAYSMPPDIFLPQYSDGRWGASFILPEEQMVNPVALMYNTGIRTYKTTSMNSNFSLQQDLGFLTEGLSAEASFFYDTSVQTQRILYDANAVRPNDGNLASKVIYPERYTGPDQDPSEYTTYVPLVGSNKFDWVVRPWEVRAEEMLNGNITRRMMYQTSLNYARKFGLHNVGALGVFKREEYARGNMFKNYREDWVFRTTYDYDGRYLFEANGAYNGSEKFGPGYRFQFFPSLAVGYYVSNEKFWNIDFMNRLKLRYSIGWVGDDQGGARWAYSNQYSYGGTGRLVGSDASALSPYTWYKQTAIGNPDIRWETAKKQNWGAEMGFLRDMFSVNLDYFNERRTDILITSRRDIPSYFGATPPSSNMGEVKARGYEVEVKFNHKFSDVFLWSNFSLTHTKNEVIYRDDPPILPNYRRLAGYSIGQQRSMIRNGFYNNWDEIFASTPTETNDLQKLPGYYHIIDFDGDGVITSNGDSAPIGYPNVPLNTYNFTIGAEYKNFSLMLQFFGVNNVSLYLPQSNFISYQNVLFEHALDYWSKDNPDATSFLPRWKTQGQNIGDYFMHDGSYLRLKTAELAYNFDKRLLAPTGLSALRLFVNGNNLLFWSKLPDDRESYSQGGSAGEGTYPTPRRINFGLELTF
jgi:TonB-linked outer membrane protein, SusC/RagA family/TonB-dependent outer membrane receptor, SusC/RagA subfamily, signature region